MIFQIECSLGRVSVDTDAREIWSDGQLVVLAPAVFDCIAYLLVHRDRAVGRDELIAGVWGRTDVSDTLLHQTIMRARRVFGDSGDEQSVLRTIPRFGYRWIAQASSGDDRDPVPHEAGKPAQGRPTDALPGSLSERGIPASAIPRHRRPVWQWGAVASLVLLAAFLFAFAAWWRPGDPARSEGGPAPRVEAEALVVLPVEVDESDDSAWISLGVMDAVGSYLRDGGVPVVPSQTVIAMLNADPGNTLDPARWQQAVGATRLLRPRAVERDGGWRVTLAMQTVDGTLRDASGDASEVLEAARRASERLLTMILPMGRSLPAGHEQDLDLSSLLQRARADILADRLDSARDLLDSAAPRYHAHSKLRLLSAEIDYLAGRMEAARVGYASLLGELTAEGHPLLRAQALIGLASIERAAVNMGAAVEGYSQAIALLEPLQEPIWLGQAHLKRGIALGSLGRFDDGLLDIARGRVLLGGAGDVHGVAASDAAVASLNANRGRVAVASGQVSKAILQFERVGATGDVLNQRLSLVEIHLELLQHAMALEQAELLWRRIEVEHRLRPPIGTAYADALIGNGRLAEAESVLAELDDPQGSRTYQWRAARTVTAELALLQGHAERAERLAAEVLDTPEVDSQGDVGVLWLTWFRALRMQDKLATASEGLARLERWSARIDEAGRVSGKVAGAEIYAALIRAEQAWVEQRSADSRHEYATALRKASELGVPQLLVKVAYSYGAALIAEGELDAATAVVGQVAEWAEVDFDCAVLTTRLHRALGNRIAWQEALAGARRLAGERRIPAGLGTFRGIEP